MTDRSKYEYINERSINEHLKCAICSDPFIYPVSTPCKHNFCRQCIEKWLEAHHACPSCRKKLSIKKLTPVTEDIVIRMLDELRVRCTSCWQTELERGSFDDHINQICPKMYVSCSSADIGCSWTGLRDHLKDHLTTCVFEPVRPVIIPLIAEKRQLKEEVNHQRTRIETQQRKIRLLKEQVQQQETKTQPLPNKTAVCKRAGISNNLTSPSHLKSSCDACRRRGCRSTPGSGHCFFPLRDFGAGRDCNDNDFRCDCHCDCHK